MTDNKAMQILAALGFASVSGADRPPLIKHRVLTLRLGRGLSLSLLPPCTPKAQGACSKLQGMLFNKKSGFTLLELLLVLVIVGFASGFAVMALGDTRGKAELKGEAVRIYATLRHLRERSLLDRMPYALVADKDAGTLTTLRNGRPAGAPHAVPSGISIDGGPAVFYPKGNAEALGFVIKDKKGRGFTVEVDHVTGTPQLKRLQSP